MKFSNSCKFILIIIFLFFGKTSFSQQLNDAQVAISKEMLARVVEGKSEDAWKLFDKENVPNVTQEQFNAFFVQMNQSLAKFGSFDLSMSGVKVISDKKLNFYSFRGVPKVGNIAGDAYVDLLFYENSKLVAGISPKQLVSVQNVPLSGSAATTTDGQETQLEGESTISIDGTSYKIRGVNIVHFEKDQCLLAIQVEKDLPEENSNTAKELKEEGVKFAKYAVRNGYVEQAKLKSKEINRKLLKDIGVSFYDPVKGKGFNVMLKSGEYK